MGGGGANGGGANGVDGGGEESLNPFTGIGGPTSPDDGRRSGRRPSTNGGAAAAAATSAGVGTYGVRCGFSRTGGTNPDSAGASWNFSIVTPDGEKYRNPINPKTNNPAMTNNILNFFAILYL